MPNKTYTTAVVLIPSEEIQPPIQAIRRVHDRNFERWMPHITLLYPFAPQRNFQDVIPALAEAAQQSTNFSVTLTSFNAFKHRKSCTLFLVPEPKNNIVDLHRTLIQISSRLRRHSKISWRIQSAPLGRTIPAPILQ